MKKLATLLGLITLTLALSAMAWGQTRPTVEERLIRVEEGIKNLEKRIDGVETSLTKRIDDTNKRIDDLRADIAEMRSMLLTGFGVVLSGMFALIGFVIWDRRTAIAPVARHAKELADFDEKTLSALREFAKTNKVMQEALRKVGML
jgi:hypothetical protein